ncbi:VOC family protein [Persicobacter diffluens]|uniref:Glyoxylase CFP32 n=1 Tax=Persicobacter diffluens TaxID=981 RepID=A0AAN5AKH2_9BACT|nr:putative glyoxylase CFP32 [Persicobacter diffluens]
MLIKYYFPLLLTLFLAACQASIQFPPISEQENPEYYPGQIIWRDLVTRDAQKAKDFYGGVFGWEFDALYKEGYQYLLVKNNGKPIAGIWGVPAKPEDSGDEWISSVSVSDVKKTLNELQPLGAESIGKVIHLKGRGTSALIKDPEGAYISLIKSDSGDPANDIESNHGWIWTELWTNDLEKSKAFYQNIGYTIEQVPGQAVAYWVLKNGDQQCAAMIQNPLDNIRSLWVPYIKVANPHMICDKVKALGGDVIMKPQENIRNGSVGICADPQGAIFAVQKYPLN